MTVMQAAQFVLIFFLVLPWPLKAQSVDTFDAMIADLETEIDRPISNAEYETLHEVSVRASGSSILICARAEVELYLGAGFGGCVDRSFNRYYIASAGAGLQAGAHLSAFTLIYRSRSGAGIEGTFAGAKAGGAIGRAGGSFGVFYRTGGKGSRRDTIFWIGYAAGFAIDISGSVMQIQKI